MPATTGALSWIAAPLLGRTCSATVVSSPTAVPAVPVIVAPLVSASGPVSVTTGATVSITKVSVLLPTWPSSSAWLATTV